MTSNLFHMLYLGINHRVSRIQNIDISITNSSHHPRHHIIHLPIYLNPQLAAERAFVMETLRNVWLKVDIVTQNNLMLPQRRDRILNDNRHGVFRTRASEWNSGRNNRLIENNKWHVNTNLIIEVRYTLGCHYLLNDSFQRQRYNPTWKNVVTEAPRDHSYYMDCVKDFFR